MTDTFDDLFVDLYNFSNFSERFWAIYGYE